jgi:glutathione-regulated potassium-efflux system ancillary protein KefG
VKEEIVSANAVEKMAKQKKILILFAHPRLSTSVVQKAMMKAVHGLEGVTFHDLYAAYPDFIIDVKREQQMLLDHDVIVFQHPFYWYSCPAIIKEWLDLVLENGWAYGTGGSKLYRKFMMNAISTGGSRDAYREGGRNRFEIEALLAPFDQSAHLCGMGFLSPFVIHTGRHLDPVELSGRAEAYRDLLVELRDGRLEPIKHLAKGYDLPKAFGAQALRAEHAT